MARKMSGGAAGDGGPVPVVPVSKLVGKMQPTPMLARMTLKLAHTYALDPVAIYARATGLAPEEARLELDKVANHTQEREAYYDELDAALEVPVQGTVATFDDMVRDAPAPDLAPMAKALTPGEILAKAGLLGQIQDAIAGRRAEKARKQALGGKAGAGKKKGSGSTKVGVVTRIQDAIAGRRAEKARKQALADAAARKAGAGAGAAKGTDGGAAAGGGWEKGPRGGTRKKVGDKWVYQGEEGAGDASAPSSDPKEKPESVSPKVKGQQQSQMPEADMIAEQGAKVVEALKKDDPEKAHDVQRALNHIVAGLRQRQKGRGTPEGDKSLLDSLKEFGRAFNSSAAPRSVLGPDLGGLLEASEKAEARNRQQKQDEEKKAALEEKTRHATSAVVSAARKVAAAVPKDADAAKKPGPDKKPDLGKSYGIPGAPIGGSSPREETPPIPDYQAIYYQPKNAANAKREAQARDVRRAAAAKQLSGKFGFHGTAIPSPEPVLRYVIPADLDVVTKKKPRAKAHDTAARRNANTAAANEHVLVAKMERGARVGGKYIKRIPYTDGKGRQRYRYFYAESAVARDVSAGEEIRLGKRLVKVDHVAKDGTITLIEADGSKVRVTPDAWGSMLTRHYGARYTEWAEKRATQSVNAVLRHVPRKLLNDLVGETDEERLADLQRRVPAVYAKLRRAFDRAGVNPFRAKAILGQTLERRGWSPEARAAVVGSVITQRTGPTNVMEVIRGAENLAGGATVDAGHVGALIELRGPRGTDLKSRIDSIAQQAEKELAALSKVLAAAHEGDDRAKAEALADVLASAAIQKLAMLSQAFPGLRDRAIEPARALLLGAPAVAPAPKPKEYGSDAVLFVAGENGTPKALRSRYRLMESADVKASHDPTAGFRRREDYPGGVQERAYHRDRAEQEKVIRNAQRLEPAIVVNTNPDAVNGPPMVTPDGIALGGNSRTMSMQLAYASQPEKAEQLKTYLREHAHEFGLTAEDVDAMKAPLLVREVAPDNGDKHSPEEMRMLVRQMNESFTQSMDPRTMQVALGRKLDDSTLETLARDMQDGETLSAFLASPRSEAFISALSRIGVIDARNQSQYLKPNTGKRKELNEDGKTLVERILVGRLVGDADVLSNTRASIVSNLARSVPYLVQAKGAGKGYDISNDMREAIESLNLLQHQQDTKTLIHALTPKMKPKEFEELFGQMTILGSGVDLPAAKNPRAKLLLEVLIRKPGPVQMASVFKEYAEAAQREPEGQGGMFGGPDPEATLRRVIETALKGDREGAAKPEPKAEKKNDDTGSLF